MKVAIIDGSNGASGDMIISSMLDVALSVEDLRRIKDVLELDLDFNIEEIDKKGIKAKKITVREKKVERSLDGVLAIIKSKLEDELAEVYQDAAKIFERIAEAEAKVHGKEVKNIVFHEVGSDDAIFDVVASSLAFNRLIKNGYKIFSTPINLGGGEVDTLHGTYAVPPPAVMEILRNSKVEVFFGDKEDGELLTPTAAAILAHFSEGTFRYTFKVEKISYGAGQRDTRKPNVLRLILGESEFTDRIAVVETNIDDASGEIIGNAINSLMEKSLDVIVIPYFGKKNRPGYLLKVICKLDEVEEVSKAIMEETGSIGTRIIPVHHRVYSFREEEDVEVSIRGKKFNIRVKRSYPGRKVIKPEFEDVKKVANELGLTILEAYREINKRI
ncbi:nickel pincer cofactor biosynthesis protein LarC [Archaeoglobales archaeon]|nr:MAG: nickel pincer cofactor biosynthesis protein LarC [Archaeoglobales archaeon]